MPQQAPNAYVPRIFGFKIFKKKGSKYHDNTKKGLKISYFGEEKEKEKKDSVNDRANNSMSDKQASS